jgi:hypothetical protein
LLNKHGSSITAGSRANTYAFLRDLAKTPLYVGEAEGHSVLDYIRAASRAQFTGLSFWQLRNEDFNDDGFVIDLHQMNDWRAQSTEQGPDGFANWVGVNLAWYQYGRDFGEDRYEPAHWGFSVLTSRMWLRRSLSRLIDRAAARPQGPLLVRAFVGTDWRAGLVYEEDRQPDPKDRRGCWDNPE